MCKGEDNIVNLEMFIVSPKGISDVEPYDLPI